jgi:hypothetical protein
MTFACMALICTSFILILVIFPSVTQPHYVFSPPASHLPSSASTTTGSAATNQLPYQTLIITRAATLTGCPLAPFFCICTPQSSDPSAHISVYQLHVSRSILTFFRVRFKHVLTHLSPISFMEDSRSWLTIHPSTSAAAYSCVVPLTQLLCHRQISASKVVRRAKNM